MSVLLTVAADPDIALVVDVDAMVRLRPLVTLPRAAPGSDEVAFGVEDENGRRRTAALRDRRAQLGAALVVVERRRAAMDYPDMILVIRPHADRHAEKPVVR